MQKSLILLLSLFYLYRSESLAECFVSQISEAKNTHINNNLQSLINKEQHHQRKLTKEINLQTQVEKVNDDIIYSNQYNIGIQAVKILEDYFQDKQREYDIFWVQMICVSGLMEFQNISQKTAHIFCEQISNPEILNKLINMKVGTYQLLMNYFKAIFKGLAPNYSEKTYHNFIYSIRSTINFDREAIISEIEQEFQNKISERYQYIENDFNNFASNLQTFFKKLLKKSKTDKLNEDKMPLGVLLKFQYPEEDLNDQIYDKINHNKYSVNTKNQLLYWQNYINYLMKKNGVEKNYLENLKEFFGIKVLDVLRDFNPEISTSNGDLFKRAYYLSDMYYTQLIKQMNQDNILFQEDMMNILQNKIKNNIIEVLDELQSDYTELSSVDLDKMFENSFKTIISKEVELYNLVRQKYLDESLPQEEQYMIMKFYRLIHFNPEIIQDIQEELNVQQGAESVINNMEKYLNFHFLIRSRFQNKINDQKMLVKIYKEKFIDKLLYHLYLRYPKNRKIIQKIVEYSFQVESIEYQNFYYYYEVVAQEFYKAIDQLDLNTINERNVFFVSQKLESVLKDIKTKVDFVINLAKNKIQDFNENSFKNSILVLIARNVSLQQHLKIDSENQYYVEDQEDFIQKLLLEYKNLKNQENVDIKLQKISNKISLLDKINIMSVGKMSDNEQKEVLKNIHFLIDHFETLPQQLQHNLIVCGRKLKNNHLEECQKTFKNQKYCKKINEFLVVENCFNQKSSNGVDQCEYYCPENFKLAYNDMCLKPTPYFNTEKNCKTNFQDWSGLCVPRCPRFWKDLGSHCQKPQIKKMKKFYLND